MIGDLAFNDVVELRVIDLMVGKSVRIGDHFKVTISEVSSSGDVHIGVFAPNNVPVDRLNVRRAKEQGRSVNRHPLTLRRSTPPSKT